MVLERSRVHPWTGGEPGDDRLEAVGIAIGSDAMSRGQRDEVAVGEQIHGNWDEAGSEGRLGGRAGTGPEDQEVHAKPPSPALETKPTGEGSPVGTLSRRAWRLATHSARRARG